MRRPATTDDSLGMDPARYDAWYRTPRGEWIGRTETALVQALIEPRPGEWLLDVGCGTGYFTAAAASAAGFAVGADRDEPMLRHAAEHRGAPMAWLLADAHRLPFADRSFDVAISITALCFVRDERHALAEMLRVARRRVVVGLLNRHSLLYLRQGLKGGQGGYRGARWHTVSQARSLFDGLAVSHVRIRSAVFFPSGGPVAQASESPLGRLRPGWGSFLAVAADKPGLDWQRS